MLLTGIVRNVNLGGETSGVALLEVWRSPFPAQFGPLSHVSSQLSPETRLADRRIGRIVELGRRTLSKEETARNGTIENDNVANELDRVRSQPATRLS